MRSFLCLSGQGTYAVNLGLMMALSFSAGVARADVVQKAIAKPIVKAIRLAPDSVVGGSSSSVIGVVMLNLRAAKGGIVVALTSANPTIASVPGHVTVPAGRTSVPFIITTHGVTTAIVVSLKATLGVTKSAALTVRPFSISTLTLEPETVVGGESAVGVVTLDGATTETMQVTLTCDDPNVRIEPATLTIKGPRASFEVQTAEVKVRTTVKITATAKGVVRSATFTVTP